MSPMTRWIWANDLLRLTMPKRFRFAGAPAEAHAPVSQAGRSTHSRQGSSLSAWMEIKRAATGIFSPDLLRRGVTICSMTVPESMLRRREASITGASGNSSAYAGCSSSPFMPVSSSAHSLADAMRNPESNTRIPSGNALKQYSQKRPVFFMPGHLSAAPSRDGAASVVISVRSGPAPKKTYPPIRPDRRTPG